MNGWLEVMDALWREGATLSYARSWRENSDGGFLKLLADRLSRRPAEPRQSKAAPDPWLEGFLTDARDVSEVDAIMPLENRVLCGWCVEREEYLTNEERDELGNDPWPVQVIELFRLRLAVSEASAARFAIGGAITDHGGRVPAICEEVMLTLALGKPVYIAGGFGGVAFAVGRLLGLAHPWTGDMPVTWRAESQEGNLAACANKLRPGPLSGLPVTLAEVATFLQQHAIGDQRWPNNGLTRADNRRLFKSKNIYEVAGLVIKGLLNRFAAR
jgi:hypothetical protein